MPKILFPASKETVEVLIDGNPHVVPGGITVAAALQISGAAHDRTTCVSGEERSAYCQVGVCFECLVEIDGVPNRQGCLVSVMQGMQIERQQGAPAFCSSEEQQ